MATAQKVPRPTQGGTRLARWLDEERRSQDWVAERAGTHQASISAWILGKRRVPLEMAVRLRNITGISIEEWTIPAEAESATSMKADPVPAKGSARSHHRAP